MPNGQYHGKKKFGIKITNPLPLAVSVRIKCPTGALHTGDGKETWRTIKPGETLNIPTKGRAEVDVIVHIIRYDELGNPKKIGDGGFRPVQQPASGKKAAPLLKKLPKRRVEPSQGKQPEEPELRSLGDMIEEMRKKEEVKV